MSLEDLLARNRAWAAAQRSRDPEFFARLAKDQRPRALWIGCSDSRVPPETLLGCGPGDLFVHRNVANLVRDSDRNLNAVVEYAVSELQVPDLVICGHYGCGGVKAACQPSLPPGSLGVWLGLAVRAQRAVDRRLARERRTVAAEDYHRMVVEENVRLQLAHLAHLAAVRRQRDLTPELPRLHGWVYDIGTGLVKVVTGSDT